MNRRNDAIISIKPKYASAILDGAKTVELRRRIPSIEVGTRLWIYSTRPIAAIVGSAILEQVVRKSPNELWIHCGDRTGVDRWVYDEYFAGAPTALGLYLSGVRRANPIGLEHLRVLLKGFHPPQVLSRLTKEDTLSLVSEICELHPA